MSIIHDPIKAVLETFGQGAKVTRRTYQSEVLYRVRYVAVYKTSGQIAARLRQEFGRRFIGLHTFTVTDVVVMEVVFYDASDNGYVQTTFDDYLKGGEDV